MLYTNRIGGVVVSVLASSVVDRGFDPLSGQTNNKIGICCFSAKHAALRRKTSWFGIRIMCPSGAICLLADCCFSELALQESNKACWSSTKPTSSSFRSKLTCSRHDIAGKIAELTFNNNHSITDYCIPSRSTRVHPGF